jgi:hypothetical protein
MPDFEGDPNPGMSRADREVSSLFSTVAGHIKGRDPQFGYEYSPSVVKPLGAMARVLQMRHGLSKAQVFERLAAASELTVAIQEHVEPLIPDDPNLIHN